MPQSIPPFLFAQKWCIKSNTGRAEVRWNELARKRTGRRHGLFHFCLSLALLHPLNAPTHPARTTNSTISIPAGTRKRLTATSEGEDEIEPAAISNDDECFFLSSGGADNKMMAITGHCCSLSHPLTHHESLTWCNVVWRKYSEWREDSIDTFNLNIFIWVLSWFLIILGGWLMFPAEVR